MPNDITALRDALGLNDLGGAIKPKEKTGAAALQDALQKTFDEGRGSNALAPQPAPRPKQVEQPSGPSYSVPWSSTPISMPTRESEVSTPEIRVPTTFSGTRELMPVMPPVGISGSTGSQSMTQSIETNDLLPKYNSNEASNSGYEDYFEGLSEDDSEHQSDIDWNDVAGALSFINPIGGMAMKRALENPTANALIKSSDAGKNLEAMYDAFNSNKIDDARTPRNASSPWATGEAMQKYGEMGMGGRDWWQYDPNALYNKADEQQDFGFVPYLPDYASRLGMTISQLLDAFGDAAGAVSAGRDVLMGLGAGKNPLAGEIGGYTIDAYGKKIDGGEWDTVATPYVNNMRKILERNPEQVLKRPKDGKLHGAPVLTEVLEYAIPNTDGGTSYLYGEVSDYGYNDDGSMFLDFTDGQSVDIPESVWSKWENKDGGIEIPFSKMSSYVRVGDAHGFLPSNLDALNERAIREKDYASAPVLYTPYLSMDDGTKLTWNEVQEIYADKAKGGNGISYDFGPLGFARPQRLSPQLWDEDGLHLESIPNNAIDYTLGSIPIMLGRGAWPTTLAQAAGKSALGIDPGKYDPRTGSDQYIAADLDEEGRIEPTYTPLQKTMNITGNALSPWLEEMAGPMSGHSWVEDNIIKEQINPTLRRLWGNFALDVLGEGVEELVGNVVDEASGQADAMYGNPITPDGARLLDDKGNPVTDANGDYRFLNAYGEPMTEWVDETGHVYKDPDTPLPDRLRNMIDLKDAVNTIVGGAEVAGLLGGPGVLRRTPAAIRGDLMERRLGMRPYVETPADRYIRDQENNEEPEITTVSPEFLRMFDDKLPEEAM